MQMTYFNLLSRVLFLGTYAYNYYLELIFRAPIGNYNNFKKFIIF